MTPTTDVEVIIAGAGPAGLTLAIDLARRNIEFLLIDKAPQPFTGSRGKGIQPRSQEVFEDLGVLDRIVASGGRYPVQRLHTDSCPVDKAAVVMPDPTPAEPYQIPLLVPQFLTESRLRERLAELGHAPGTTTTSLTSTRTRTACPRGSPVRTASGPFGPPTWSAPTADRASSAGHWTSRSRAKPLVCGRSWPTCW